MMRRGIMEEFMVLLEHIKNSSYLKMNKYWFSFVWVLLFHFGMIGCSVYDNQLSEFKVKKKRLDYNKFESGYFTLNKKQMEQQMERYFPRNFILASNNMFIGSMGGIMDFKHWYKFQFENKTNLFYMSNAHVGQYFYKSDTIYIEHYRVTNFPIVSARLTVHKANCRIENDSILIVSSMEFKNSENFSGFPPGLHKVKYNPPLIFNFIKSDSINIWTNDPRIRNEFNKIQKVNIR